MYVALQRAAYRHMQEIKISRLAWLFGSGLGSGDRSNIHHLPIRGACLTLNLLRTPGHGCCDLPLLILVKPRPSDAFAI